MTYNVLMGTLTLLTPSLQNNLRDLAGIMGQSQTPFVFQAQYICRIRTATTKHSTNTHITYIYLLTPRLSEIC